MRLRAVRSHFIAGIVKAVGEVYEVDDRTGRELILSRKSEMAPPEKAVAEPAEPEPEKRGRGRPRKPMTTETASGLVAGAQTEDHDNAE